MNTNELSNEFPTNYQVDYCRKRTPYHEAEFKAKKDLAKLIGRLERYGYYHNDDLISFFEKKKTELNEVGIQLTPKNLNRFKSQFEWVDIYIQATKLDKILKDQTFYKFPKGKEYLTPKQREYLLIKCYRTCGKLYSYRFKSIKSSHEDEDSLTSETYDHLFYSLRIFKKPDVKTLDDMIPYFISFFKKHIGFYLTKTLSPDRKHSLKKSSIQKRPGIKKDPTLKAVDDYSNHFGKDTPEVIKALSTTPEEFEMKKEVHVLFERMSTLPQELQEHIYSLYGIRPDSNKDHEYKNSVLKLRLGGTIKEQIQNLEKIRIFIEEVAEELGLDMGGNIANKADELMDTILSERNEKALDNLLKEVA